MKIHDKFVIELAEVVKGYGNDYQVKEPAKLPCDYKFYEISGVAICEESFKKMKPLNDEINNVLDSIRAEISDLDTHYDNDYFVGNKDAMFKCQEVLRIIDKYRKEQTDADSD